MSDKKKPPFSKRLMLWIGSLMAILVLILAMSILVARAYAREYEGRILPGVQILGVRLDGLTTEEADKVLHRAIDERLAQGLRFDFRGQERRLDVTPPSANDPDATHDLIRYDTDAVVSAAMQLGHGADLQTRILTPLRARLQPITLPAEVILDTSRIETALRQAFRKELVSAKDASFSIITASGSSPMVHVVPETIGLDFKVAEALDRLRTQAQNLQFESIHLQEIQTLPTIRHEDLEPLRGEASAFVNRPSLTFTYEDRSFSIPTSTLASWITVAQEGKKLHLTFDPEKVRTTFKELAPSLDREATNGSLVIKDGHIDSFVAGTQGSRIRIDETLKPVLAEWPATTTFPLLVEVVSGSLVGEDPARLGIKEIIGVGHSNFSGSPVNRRKNIQKGIDKVNGTLIAPGEEFSLLKTLGSIDGEHGWLPELVIKGDKTTPEFGGGLCQIGTTTFRGALDSGLKITQRHNHSYRVRYYEPAGTDATIYEPSPDFRFVNDTGHFILINAYHKEDDVIFEFWGTKDGRKIDPIQSHTYNITAPPPPKLIETLDLPLGKKKCTETAHAGADAEFTYKIVYPDGTVHEEVFKSHYRPWQAVCLVGVEKLSTSSSTDGLE